MHRLKWPVLTLLPVLLVVYFSCTMRMPKVTYTGLYVYKNIDSSRTFDTTSRQSPFYYRPVKIDLYYPSTDMPSTAALQYGDVLDMYEQRMNYNISTDSCRKVSREMAKAFAQYLHLDSADKILSCTTQLYTGLVLPVKKRPLIIYAAGMNGSSWENVILFDSLTKAGYVVAAVSSVGTYPGYMTNAADLEQQVQDILYTCREMKKLSFVDPGKIGLLSWSMGGSAISKAAMLSKEFKCLLSFDGTEVHYYGYDAHWDEEYSQLKTTGVYNPAAITVPYLYLSGEHPAKIDSIDVLPLHTRSKDKFFLKLVGGTHENFSSIVSIVEQADPELGDLDEGRHAVICGLTLTFFNQYLAKTGNTKTVDYIARLLIESPDGYSTQWPKR